MINDELRYPYFKLVVVEKPLKLNVENHLFIVLEEGNEVEISGCVTGIYIDMPVGDLTKMTVTSHLPVIVHEEEKL